MQWANYYQKPDKAYRSNFHVLFAGNLDILVMKLSFCLQKKIDEQSTRRAPYIYVHKTMFLMKVQRHFIWLKSVP